MYIYIYSVCIYMCVCVCVCVCSLDISLAVSKVTESQLVNFQCCGFLLLGYYLTYASWEFSVGQGCCFSPCIIFTTTAFKVTSQQRPSYCCLIRTFLANCTNFSLPFNSICASIFNEFSTFLFYSSLWYLGFFLICPEFL